MSDLIDREAAIDALHMHLMYRMGTDSNKKRLDDWINGVPSAQPEIIHCRDCRWRNDQNGSTAWLPCRAIVTPSDFYCGRAERRTDGCR